jgi:hypothetical protein
VADSFSVWWANNWDKVITALVSVVLSGVIGFFSAVISIRSEMSTLGERTAKLEAQVSTAVLPKLQTSDDNSTKIVKIQDELQTIKTQTDIASSTNKYLDLRMEQAKTETIQALKSALEEARKQSAAAK